MSLHCKQGFHFISEFPNGQGKKGRVGFLPHFYQRIVTGTEQGLVCGNTLPIVRCLLRWGERHSCSPSLYLMAGTQP